MSISRMVWAAAALAAFTGPAVAQEVIYEPGYCAFYYPNANCQNIGPGNPYTRGYAPRVSQVVPVGGQTAGVVRKRTHKSAMRTQ